jgi:hypothetical protein
MTKTISKNRKAAIEEIFNQATKCVVYSDSNSYQGRECDKAYAKKELFQFSSAKLYKGSDTAYCVHVTSTCWYDLTLPENPTLPTRRNSGAVNCYCSSLPGREACDFCNGYRVAV